MLRAAEPQEGCALLLGQRRGPVLVLERIWPCCNRWQPAEERHRRFLLDPREQLLAQRWARDQGIQVLGSAHSHPRSAAIPSETDRQLCWGPTLMLIRSGLPSGPAAAPALRAWWLPERPEQAALELLIEPAAADPSGQPGHLGE